MFFSLWPPFERGSSRTTLPAHTLCGWYKGLCYLCPVSECVLSLPHKCKGHAVSIMIVWSDLHYFAESVVGLCSGEVLDNSNVDSCLFLWQPVPITSVWTEKINVFSYFLKTIGTLWYCYPHPDACCALLSEERFASPNSSRPWLDLISQLT